MPIPILLHAGLSLLTGEYLLSGKILSLISFGSLIAVVFVILRRLRCPIPLSIALVSVVPATYPGMFSALSISGDVLPLVLQVSAVEVVRRATTRLALLAAAILCVLAFFSKASAVWAPLAIVLWLLVKRKPQLKVFVGSLISVLAVAFALFLLVTHGLLTNVFGLSFAYIPKSLTRPITFAPSFVKTTTPAALLIPLAWLGMVLALPRRGLTIYQLSFACSVAVTGLVLMDYGADFNHLLDVIVLTVILVGELWYGSQLSSARSWLAIPTALILICALGFSYRTIGSPTRTALQSVFGGTGGARYSKDALAPFVHPGDQVLTEDPSIPVELGERPVVLDPFMFLYIGKRHPQWVQALRNRVDNETFKEVVLIRRLNPSSQYWYTVWAFGGRIYAALTRHYRLRSSTKEGFVYVPVTQRSFGK